METAKSSIQRKRFTNYRADNVGCLLRLAQAAGVSSTIRLIGKSAELLKGDYIQADETPVDVQMHDGRGKNHQAYLWQYSRPEGSVVFDFRMGREREGPKRFLGNFEGILQSDGLGGLRSCRRSQNRPCGVLGAC